MHSPNTPEEEALVAVKKKAAAEFKNEIQALMDKYSFKAYFVTVSDEVIPCPDIELFGVCKGKHYGKTLTYGVKTYGYLAGMIEQSLSEQVEEYFNALRPPEENN